MNIFNSLVLHATYHIWKHLHDEKSKSIQLCKSLQVENDIVKHLFDVLF